MGKKESHATDHPVLRVLFLCGGLTVMAFGVACSVKAGLGTSPISSVPYVTSRISGLSAGATTVVMNVLFILIQIAILRKAYDRFQLLQLPATLLFGAMIDAAGYLLQTVSCAGYVWQWLMCAVGIVLVALGVSMEVMAGLITTAGEGIVLAITRVAPVKFSTMKVALDVTLVAVAVLLSFPPLGQLDGVREGTVAAAVCVGLVTRLTNRLMTRVEALCLRP